MFHALSIDEADSFEKPNSSHKTSQLALRGEPEGVSLSIDHSLRSAERGLIRLKLIESGGWLSIVKQKETDLNPHHSSRASSFIMNLKQLQRLEMPLNLGHQMDSSLTRKFNLGLIFTQEAKANRIAYCRPLPLMVSDRHGLLDLQWFNAFDFDAFNQLRLGEVSKDRGGSGWHPLMKKERISCLVSYSSLRLLDLLVNQIQVKS